MEKQRIRLIVSILLTLWGWSFSEGVASAQSPVLLRLQPKPSAQVRWPISPPVRKPLPTPPQPRSPEIFFCETADPSCRTTADAFAIDDLRDLFVFVVWPGLTGAHIQSVQFFLPDGSLYQEKKASFTLGWAVPIAWANPVLAQRVVGPPAEAPQFIASANRQHPVGISSLLATSRGDSTVLTVLPVAGTYISQRNLAGTWQVRVLLDGNPALASNLTLRSRTPAVGAAEEQGRQP